MKSYGLSRRALLRALGGGALALPMLDLTRRKAFAAVAPKRFVLMYAGMSAGRDGMGRNPLTPGTVGRGYELSRALASLGPGATPYGDPGYDIQDDVSLVSGLQVPWGSGDDIPSGGRSGDFHFNTAEPQTTGTRRGPGGEEGPAASSADILVGDTIGASRLHRSLAYRVQAARYIRGANSTSGGLGSITRRRLDDGSLDMIEPVISPRLAYRSLFSGIMPEGGGDDAATARLRQRRDVLSAVHARSSAVMARLGTVDRFRVQRHLQELSALQARLDMIPETMIGGVCIPPASPGEDPPIADGHDSFDDGDDINYVAGRGWSQETERGNAMVDMIRMAFACNLTQSVGYRITLDQTFIDGDGAVGAHSDMHELTHGAESEGAFEDALGWHVSFFSRLVRGLRDTEDIDGRTLLDNTTVVLLFEGGYGYDPESGTSETAHATENMTALIGGRGGGLVPGVHVQTDRLHPAQVIASAFQSIGMEDRLGEVEGRIPGLFGG